MPGSYFSTCVVLGKSFSFLRVLKLNPQDNTVLDKTEIIVSSEALFF